MYFRVLVRVRIRSCSCSCVLVFGCVPVRVRVGVRYVVIMTYVRSKRNTTHPCRIFLHN